MQCLFEKVNQFHLSLESYQDTKQNSEKLSRYQKKKRKSYQDTKKNSEILLSLNVTALSNSYMFIRSLQV